MRSAARDRTILASLVVAYLVRGLACTETPADPQSPYDQEALLTRVHESAQPLAQEVRDSAVALASAATRSPEDARAAWLVMMDRWQAVDLWRVGVPGLRDEVYSWPTVSPCRVDQELVAHGYEDPEFFDHALVNAYGLAAMEYLLFHEGTENSCPAQALINSEGTWALLSVEELATRRMRYAKVLAEHVLETTARLSDFWNRDDPFQGAVPSEVIDDVISSLFYLDWVVKDRKLAMPLGLRDCATARCPEALESPWALRAREDVAANLRGFGALLEAFMPTLRELGAGTLGENMARELATARQVVESMSRRFDEALVENPGELQALHDAIKRITDLLKTDFIAALGTSLPQEGAGDSD